MHNRYKKDISFISVNAFDEKERIEKFIFKNPIQNFIAIDNSKILYKAFNIASIPVSILIDKDGYIRWRGLANELSEELIDTFLTTNIIKPIPQGTIFDKQFTIELNDKIEYQLKAEYGDNTSGNTVGYEFDEEFEFYTLGSDLYSILPQLTNWFNMEEEWIYNTSNIKQKTINIYIKSNKTLVNKEDRKKIINDAINNLSEQLNFDIADTNVQKETWYMVPDTIAIKKHLSIDQNLDYEITRTKKLTNYKNIYFGHLVQVISRNTNKRIKIENIYTGKNYDLSIPKTDDFHVIQKYFMDNYKINFIKKEETVKQRTVTFK